ncbi:DUF2934 domain-containing protein [Pseudorhizobium xiangyangii]|uniref:DUF2934 domain-containing protein n=1 Tax=Pseudorhizobium xiangyangii TaxID=2883104 RepID=UPI0028F4215C|nr:DUF2934 domain-containing protein [Neorhizobium xiangyangii]
MGIDREEWISKRAYELWEQAGRPDGKDDEQWSAASAEWEAKSRGAADHSPVSATLDDES